METTVRQKEEFSSQRRSGFGARALYKNSTKVPDSESEDKLESNGDISERESRRHSDGEESESASDQDESEKSGSESKSIFHSDGEESENAPYHGEKEESESESTLHSNSGEIERNSGQDESGESGSGSDPASDVEDDAYSASADLRNVTEDDVRWVAGLGSLTGHQITQAA
jgi:hypothetical protein